MDRIPREARLVHGPTGNPDSPEPFGGRALTFPVLTRPAARIRERGEDRVVLGPVVAALGPNFVRLSDWLAGTPRASS
ncbi:MAG TPA: hypothetical protein VIL85_25960 [Thermomicrobiales bacterium]